jgi:outer membrane protein assembly factor BamB
MAITDPSVGPEKAVEIVQAVVPTLALPLAAVAFGLNALATVIAGWFGVRLHWEGPKRLLEVLLNKRVLLAALGLNLAGYAAYRGWQWSSHLPSPLWRIEHLNRRTQAESEELVAAARVYPDSVNRANVWAAPAAATKLAAPRQIRQAWRARLPKGIFGGATLSGASLFVGSDDGYVYELARSDGRIRRRFFVGTEVTPEPVVWHDRLFVGEGTHDTHGARLYAFDLMSGALLGSFKTEGHTEGMPILATSEGVSTLFVMAGKDGLYALDPEHLTRRWHQILGHTDSEVRVHDGLVYFATGVEKGFPDTRRRAYALDFATGAIVWERELAASGWMAPVITDREACFGLGEIYGPSQLGQLACFDLKTGRPGLTLSFDGPLLGIPMRVGKDLIVADVHGQICGVDYARGYTAWCHPSPTAAKATFASPTSDGRGRVLYPSPSEGLLVLDAGTGRLEARWRPGPSEGAWARTYSRAVVGDDGWFLTDMDGNVRKLSAPGPLRSSP